MQYIFDPKPLNPDTMVVEETAIEKIEKEMQEISNKNMKFIIQFIILSTTNYEYFQYTKDNLTRLHELSLLKAIELAPNRAVRSKLTKEHKTSMKNFRQIIKNFDKVLRYFSEYWEKDPEYGEFVDENMDKLGALLDSIKLATK